MKRKLGWLVAAGCLLAIGATGCATSQTGASSAKENFYVFLCFGQSNMEGYPRTIEEQDKTVDERFQVLAAVDFKDPNRTKGNWYPAVPPLCRPGCGLCPADYFGRTLVANLPKNVRVGVINVSVAGCKIEMFQKDKYEAYVSKEAAWMKNIVKQYDGNPYGRLVQLAKQAQQVGVIKGILLHQGESNGGDREWGTKVKSVYDDLLKDLELKPDSVPLLGGELVGSAGLWRNCPRRPRTSMRFPRRAAEASRAACISVQPGTGSWASGTARRCSNCWASRSRHPWCPPWHRRHAEVPFPSID